MDGETQISIACYIVSAFLLLYVCDMPNFLLNEYEWMNEWLKSDNFCNKWQL